MPKPFIKAQNKQVYTFYKSGNRNQHGVELLEKTKVEPNKNEQQDGSDEYYEEGDEYYDEDDEYYDDEEDEDYEDDEEDEENVPKLVPVINESNKFDKGDDLSLLGFKKDGYDYSKWMKEITGGGTYIPAVYDLNELKKHKKGIQEFITTSTPPTSMFGLEEISKDYVKSEKELAKFNVEEDIIEALGDDGEFEELDEDFILQANGGNLDGLGDQIKETKDRLKSFNLNDDDQDDDYPEEEGSQFGGEYYYDENGIRRRVDLEKQNRVVKDDVLQYQFEKVLEEYDDDELGELGYEDTKGQFTTDKFDDVFDEFIENYEINHLPLMTHLENLKKNHSFVPLTDAEKKQIIERDWEKEVLVVEVEEEKPEEKWDCETILTTYSNLYNHPSLIRENNNKPRTIIKLGKNGIPIRNNKEVEESDEEEEEEKENLGVAIDKNESKEDKKARKQKVKESKKLAREQKKSLKIAFKQEEIKQTTIVKSQKSSKLVAVRY